MRGARPNHCTRAGAPRAPRAARPGPRPRAREGARGGRPTGGAAGAAPGRRAGRRGRAWARREAVRGRLPAPGRRALGAVVEAAGGGDAAALLLRCRWESPRRRPLRARTPVHGTQGGGRRSCPSLARRRRAALVGESGGRGGEASPALQPPPVAAARRERVPRAAPAPPAPRPRPPPRGLAARARRDDLPRQRRHPRGRRQLQDAPSQAGEAAAGAPRGGRRRAPHRVRAAPSAAPGGAVTLPRRRRPAGTARAGDLSGGAASPPAGPGGPRRRGGGCAAGAEARRRGLCAAPQQVWGCREPLCARECGQESSRLAAVRARSLRGARCAGNPEDPGVCSCGPPPSPPRVFLQKKKRNRNLCHFLKVFSFQQHREIL